MMFDEIVKKGLSDWGIPCSQEQLARLRGFMDLLLEKNKVMNLTAIVEPEQVAVKHILDCLFLLKGNKLQGKKIIDIGCGAGFPGMPLKLFDPDMDITMLDSTAKRIAFINESALALGIETKGIAGRAEEYVAQSGMREGFDIALSRAVAPLNILAEISLPYVAVGGFFMPMKSANTACDAEIKQAKHALAELGGKLVEVCDYTLPGVEGEHRIIIIEKVKLTHKLYPRRFSKISALPL